MGLFNRKSEAQRQLEQMMSEMNGKCACVTSRLEAIERRIERLEEHDKSCDRNFNDVASTLARLAQYHEHE